MSDLKVFEYIINLHVFTNLFFETKGNFLKMINIIQQILDMIYEEF